MLLDSNINIYGSQPEHGFLRFLLNADDSVVSGLTLFNPFDRPATV